MSQKSSNFAASPDDIGDKMSNSKTVFVMKRIRFIEPVDALQGKLTGNRKLTYPTRNNSAWEAPTGKSYATNYRPSYIGNLRVKDGVTYFSTKVRSSVTMNDATRLAQALLGASASITASMLKNPQILSIVQTAYQINQPEGLTLNKFCQAEVRASLEAHTDFSFIGQSTWNYVANPYLKLHHSGAIAITGLNKDILVKFWNQLAPDSLTFSVLSKTAISFQDFSFTDIISNSSINVLNFSTYEGVPEKIYVKSDSLFLLDSNGNYVTSNTIPTQGQRFTLTPVEPEE